MTTGPLKPGTGPLGALTREERDRRFSVAMTSGSIADRAAWKAHLNACQTILNDATRLGAPEAVRQAILTVMDRGPNMNVPW